MVRLTFESTSEEATLEFGAVVAELLRPGDVLALHGELGAGKTRLVRGLARGLGVDERMVASPTFVVMHEYPSVAPGEGGRGEGRRRGVPLVHIDAYRLGESGGGEDELETLGWDRVADGSAIIAVEWPERAPSLPTGDRRGDLWIQTLSEEERRFRLEIPEVWAEREGYEALDRFLRMRAHTAGLAGVSLPGAGGLPAGWVRCPVCRKPVAPDCPTFPFSDERCRLVDLGKWATGEYSVSREIEEDDLIDRGGSAG